MSLSNKLAVPQVKTSKDPWDVARQRTRAYLSLQRVPESMCEQILQQTAQHLPATAPKAEAEQIQVFLQTAQKVAQTVMGCGYSELSQLNNSRVATWTARKTCPRVERSSIKVAPLQAISLRLNAMRQAAGL